MLRNTFLILSTGAALGLAALAAGGQSSTPDGAAGSSASSPASPGTQGSGHRGQYAGMGRVAGEVTGIAGATLTVKGEDGSAVQVVTTDNTQFMKERGPVRLSEMHVGDGLMAIGNLDPATHTLHAAMVMAEDAAQIKAMRENLGKTYITGRVTAVDLDDAKMTVERPDHVAQTIGFDEGTSFKRAVRPQRTAGENGGGNGTGRGAGGGFGGGMGMMAGSGAGLEQAFKDGESITLADIKVGDRVVGSGALKSGVFVPVHLLDSPPGPRRGRGEAGAAGAPAGGAPAGPNSAGPNSAGPNSAGPGSGPAAQ